MDPRDEDAMLGQTMQQFLAEVTAWCNQSGSGLHFVTAREMANIIWAVIEGKEGDPGKFRDYRFQRVASRQAGADPQSAKVS